MNFSLDGFNVYMIRKSEDGFYISNCNGFLMEAEQMVEIATGLIKYANKYKNEITVYNQNRRIEVDNELNGYWNEMNRVTTTSKKRNTEGYIYLFECGGKYKIGFSSNVERRIKELDYRPFEINLITKSNLLSNAYDLEQELHSKYEQYKITGEWYEFSKSEIDEVVSYLENLTEVE